MKKFLSFFVNIGDVIHAYNMIHEKHFLGNLLTITIISLSAFLPLFFLLCITNFQAFSNNINNNKTITIYIDGNVDTLDAASIKDELEYFPEIERATFISKDESIQEFSSVIGVSLEDFLVDDINPMPHAIDLHLVSNTTNDLNEVIKSIKNKYNDIIIKVDANWLSKYESLSRLVTVVASIISIIMVFSIFLIISNIVTKRIYFYKHELGIIKSLGATDWFLCRPYVYLGVLFSLYSIFGTWWLLCLVYVIIDEYFNHFAALYDEKITFDFFSILQVFAFTFLFVIIFSIVTYFTTYFHIRKIEIR